MQIAKPENGGYVLIDVRAEFPNTSLPSSGPTPDFLAEHGYYKVSFWKDHNSATHKLQTCDPYLDGDTVRTVIAVPLSAEEIAAAEATAIKTKEEALWSAADRYTSGYISGVAVGLLTIGLIQNLPKAQAVSAWSAAVWDEYYRRKALITATSEDNHDFTSIGPMPHSVPELRTELGM